MLAEHSLSAIRHGKQIHLWECTVPSQAAMWTLKACQEGEWSRYKADEVWALIKMWMTARDVFSSTLLGSRPKEEQVMVASVRLEASWCVLLFTSSFLLKDTSNREKQIKRPYFWKWLPKIWLCSSSGGMCQAGVGFMLPARRGQWSNMFLDRNYKNKMKIQKHLILRLWAVSCRFRKAAWLSPSGGTKPWLGAGPENITWENTAGRS